MERYGQGSPYLRIKGILSTPEWKAAWNILSRPDLESHIYIPGVGYVNGLQSGNFVESTGNTACAVDTEVGLVLDAAGIVGAELIANPDFSAGYWYKNGVTVTGTNVLGFPAVGNEVSILSSGEPSASKMYAVTAKLSGNGTISLGVTNNVDQAVRPSVSLTATPTDFTVYCQMNGTAASNASVHLRRATGDTATTVTVHSLSWKRVTGTHATQSTTANKPILRRGILNQALWSGDFSNSAWIKQSLNLSAAGDNPPTGSTGQLLTSTGSFAATAPASPIAAGAGQSVTMAFEVKAGAGATVATLVDETQGGTCYAQVTLATGVVGATGFVTASSSVDLGNGWWLVAATYTVQAGKTSVLPRSWVGAYSGANTAGQSIKVGRAGLFQGTLTAQQIIAAGGIPLTTTAPASSQYGIGEPSFGTELIANGDFSNGTTGWLLNNSQGTGVATISGGVLTIARTDPSNFGARVSDAFATSPGKSYRVSFDVSGAAAWVYKVGAAGASYPVGRQGFDFVATATTSQIGFEAANNGSTTVIDNVSVKEITGYKSLPNSYAWQFDGSNDALALPGPLFQQADDHCVIVGANPNVLDGTLRRLFTQENGSPTVCEIAGYNVGYTATWRDDAAVATSIATPAIPAGTPVVLSARKVGNTRTLRNAGVQAGTDTRVLGSTTLGTVAYIGNRAAGDRPWNGLVYPTIIIKGTVSDAELRVLEVAVASTAGVTIP